MPLPGLQRDSHDPSRALPHGGAKFSGEVLARRNETALTLGNGHEKLRAPKPMHPEAVLVIFRKTRRLEDAIRVGCREFFECFAFESRSNSARRNKAAQHLPR